MGERPKKWTFQQLREAAKTSSSIRQVIVKLGLVPAGGNYVQIQRYIKEDGVSITHFSGKGWRKGTRKPVVAPRSLKEILIINSSYQSHELKLRLWGEKLKPMACEQCGWAKKAIDGRLPLELDHVNGDRYDNRIENLRILCPNCHSLQPTHRGRNKKHY